MAIVVPEVILYNLVNGILNHLRIDYNQHTNKEATLLYNMFHQLKQGKMDYYEEAVDLFAKRSPEHPRRIETMIGLSSHKTEVPRIFITLASEVAGPNEIGVGEYGHEDHVTIGSGVNKNEYAPNYMRRFTSKYMVVCMSESQNECLLMYNTLKASLVSVFDSVELGGLRNVKLGGQDLRINGDLVPQNVHMRGIVIDAFHEVEVPRFFTSDQITKIIVEGGKPSST